MAYIEDTDAQLVLDKYMEKKNASPEFYFAHDVDELDQLCRIFWADPKARHNFKLFGDTMSFDATYGTNRYKLVFVPFTGVDHHKKSVTFAAGLIAREDVDSYTWLLEHFKKAMGKVPACTVTDQDPAMKVAIARVFDSTRHRYCMWHIMTKVCEKVGPTLAKSEGFLSSLNNVVWNDTQIIQEFETAWQTIMVKYQLVEHKWFTHLFEIRAQWIPVFFNDVFMGGLLRTTSRSESENNVFSKCTSPHLSLSEFFTKFEKAIYKQRHYQLQLNAENEGKFPDVRTPFLIERQAATTYTIAVFYDVQKEIADACFASQVIKKTIEGCNIHFDIEDTDKSTHSVEYNSTNRTVQCTCKMFHRIGIQCKHVFLAFKAANLDRIPSQYILPRWSRNTCWPHTEIYANNDQHDTPEHANGNTRMGTVFDEFFKCVGYAYGNNDKITELAQLLKAHREKSAESISQDKPRASKTRSYVASVGPPHHQTSRSTPLQLLRTRVLESVSSQQRRLHQH
ncbi:PREDICTED: protein FAR1-RELATED SEQUENCE 5-like [Ipomoea nil]|uniref:protein FAR1-RELATED SEQUENCE 5-like n=1 Tax=Ipomoea nil TaxID=35883 RepID=UPI000901F79A|nr:PREDICTED: protein FAR1-RELATED SEQUENCE 5-like [Ipomoea nil]